MLLEIGKESITFSACHFSARHFGISFGVCLLISLPWQEKALKWLYEINQFTGRGFKQAFISFSLSLSVCFLYECPCLTVVSLPRNPSWWPAMTVSAAFSRNIALLWLKLTIPLFGAGKVGCRHSCVPLSPLDPKYSTGSKCFSSGKWLIW